MEGTQNISFLMAFAAGFLAFLSPCILPLIPAYVSYLTGVSFGEFSGELTKEKKRKLAFATAFHSLAFIIGFTIVFVLLGASITFIGKALLEYQPLLKKIGGVFIIVFGFIVADIIRIPFLIKEKKFSYKKKGISILGSVMVGAAFAAAWTPCIGPILGSILIYASSAENIKAGIKLLIAFSAGLAVPFFISSIAINSFLAYIKKINKYLRWIKILAGIILVFFGLTMLIGG